MIEQAGLMEVIDITTVYPEHEADVRPRIPHMAPARTLPTLTLPCGTQLGDIMAIAEELTAATHTAICGLRTPKPARLLAIWRTRCTPALEHCEAAGP